MPECQFSLPYAVASAAFDDKVFIDTYSAEARERPEVRELMTRISAIEDPSVSDWGARLTTTLRDGRVLENTYTYVKGHPRNPFSEQDFIDKFRLCVPYSVLPLSDAVVETMIQDVLTLERFEDVIPVLIDPLVPAA